ncbi:chemotaxis protein CheA [Lichenihabitans sp. Uapishka_5]|uniref:chemotaxis protein CheA n=1 Tax=Lichenihabitans sp. Uapishka_5 TaxID=3037302 RepID=UPI003FA58BE0
MAAIKQTFFQECEEQLTELEAGLLQLDDGNHDSEVVNAVFRAVHSIKGGAGAFNLTALVQFAHVFESAMDRVRVGKLHPSPDVLRVMLRAADVLADFVRAAREDDVVPAERSAGIVLELKALAEGQGVAPAGAAPAPAPVAEAEAELEFIPIAIDLSSFDDLLAPPSGPAGFRIGFKPHPALYANGNEAVILIREVGRLGTLRVTCDTDEAPGLDGLDPEGAYLFWTLELETDKSEADVRSIFDFAEYDCVLSFEPLAAPAALPDLPVVETELEFHAIPVEFVALPDEPVAVAPPAIEAPLAPSPAAPRAAVEPPHAEAAAAGAKREVAAAAAPTIRVDLERVDRLINLVGELVINQAMLAVRVTEAGLARVSAVAVGLDELEQLTREIQDSVMAIRAQPVRSVFQRMPRLVREVAAQTGKTVRLVTEGEGTEVDKTVIERLSDPLTHMIRNAIDHGLEKPEKRLAAGKPEEGLVKLVALHRSGRIVIEVSDDGGGINRERVRQIAVDKGLISPDAKLTDDEIDNLIFLPGFSTAAVVSDISGRGVGMDVVKRSIQALGGRIAISSRPGEGSTFTMSLPLTLAVLDGMVVTVADQTLVIPLTAIVETLLPRSTTVHNYGEGTRLIGVRNGFIPLIDVGEMLQFRPGVDDPKTGIALLVETEGGARNALLVDAIQGQRQVVIKSLETNYGHVPGIAAATILGDGRVALILDVDAVVSASRDDAAAQSFALAG